MFRAKFTNKKKQQLVREYLALPRHGRRVLHGTMEAFCKKWECSISYIYTTVRELTPKKDRGMMEGQITEGWSELYPGSHYEDDEVELLKAMHKYMVKNRRPFPTFTEVLAVVRSLGYRKVAKHEGNGYTNCDLCLYGGLRYDPNSGVYE